MDFRKLGDYMNNYDDVIFSVILNKPNENLNNSIDSLLNQSISPKRIELIIVNKNKEFNTDFYNKYNDTFNNIILVDDSNTNYTFSDLLRIPIGKYVTFLNSSDYFLKNTFLDVYSFYEQNYSQIDILNIPINKSDNNNLSNEINQKVTFDNIIQLNEDPNNPLILLNSLFVKKESLDLILENEDSNLNYVTLINKLLEQNCKYGVISSGGYEKKINPKNKYFIEIFDLGKNDYNKLLSGIYDYLSEISIKYKKIPTYIQYNIIYFLSQIIKIEDDEYLSFTDVEDTQIIINKIMIYICKEAILENKYLKNNIKSFLIYMKNGKKRYELSENSNELILKTDTYIIDKLSVHKIWLDIVEIKNNNLIISGLLNTNFDSKNISINLKVLSDDKIKNYSAEILDYPQDGRKNIKFLYQSWQFRYNFNLVIPLTQFEQMHTFFEVKFSSKDITFNYQPLLEFRLTTGLSNIGLYYTKKPYIIYHDSKSISIINYEYSKMFKLELRNILKIFKSNEQHKFRAIFMRMLYLLLYPILSKKKIWLINDRLDSADDNAIHLFKYMINKEDNITKFFVIDKKSKDYEYLNKHYDNIVKYGSFKHKMIYIYSDKLISSFLNEAFFNPFYNQKDYDDRLLYNNLVVSPRYFLQHGVISCDLTKHIKKFNHNLNLIVTSSDLERNSFYELKYNYSEDVVQALGLPRYDHLVKTNTKKQIIYIPSWRSYLDKNEEKLLNSDYFNSIKSLINNTKLQELLKEYDYEFIFKPHPELVKYHNLFKTNENIIIDINKSYQEIFNSSALLISDFSSVIFDFAYLKKPIIYYQPNDDYHYDKGYFDYETMGFGEIIKNEYDLIQIIKKYLDKSCIMEDKYQKRVDNFFKYHDKNNSKRVYEWILKN